MDRRNELIDAIIACKFPNYWLVLNVGAASEDEQLMEIELGRDIDAERGRLAEWSEDDLEMELDFASDAEQRQSRPEPPTPVKKRQRAAVAAVARIALDALRKRYGNTLPTISTKRLIYEAQEWARQQNFTIPSERSLQRAISDFKQNTE